MIGITTHLSMVRNAMYCGGFSRSASLASICPEKRALFFSCPTQSLHKERSSSATRLHNYEVNHRRDSDSGEIEPRYASRTQRRIGARTIVASRDGVGSARSRLARAPLASQ